MAVQPVAGMMAISVDMDVPVGIAGVRGRGTAESVFDWLRGRQLPATYAFADPCGTRLADAVLASATAGEIALLADASWAGPNASRARLATELARHTRRALASGYALTTLALRDAAAAPHVDLLAKHGISVVRQRAPARRLGLLGWLANWRGVARRRQGADPRPIRFGLWSLGPNLVLPGAGYGRACRAIDRAAIGHGLVHLVIDGPLLATVRGPAWRTFERIVAHAARRRDEGSLAVVTLADVAGRLGHRSAVGPARSILRPQAA
jgi:hypothetical protein